VFSKPLDELTINDIKDLVLNRKEEEKNFLEYKQEIKTNNDFKKKILRLISGFANAKDGYVIFGVKEARKENPPEIIGIERYINGLQKIEE
jgi:predicted HTH transcriptional regulator